jgi:hypothetical protein
MIRCRAEEVSVTIEVRKGEASANVSTELDRVVEVAWKRNLHSPRPK